MTEMEPVVADLREAEFARDAIVSKSLVENDHHKIILFTLAAGQELSEHTASVPASIHILAARAPSSSPGRSTRPGRECSTTCRPSSGTRSGRGTIWPSCSPCSARDVGRRATQRAIRRRGVEVRTPRARPRVHTVVSCRAAVAGRRRACRGGCRAVRPAAAAPRPQPTVTVDRHALAERHRRRPRRRRRATSRHG